MTVVAVSMFRDEEDVAETVCRHLLAEGVDHLIVADNLSDDGTREILEAIDGVTVVDDLEPGYYQSRKMSHLAQMAYSYGADWVLPFDADEVWYSEKGTIAEALGAVRDDVQVVKASGWDHIHPGRSKLAEKPGEFDQWVPYVGPFSPWRRAQAQQLVKVAFRANPDPTIEMGNHAVSLPGTDGRETFGVLAFRHFQYRSLEQMTRKLRQGRAAYEASDVHLMHGMHWRAGGLKSDEELARDWATLCAEEGLVFDPAPLRVPVS